LSSSLKVISSSQNKQQQTAEICSGIKEKKNDEKKIAGT
jgi:hypothetical protein